MEMDETGHYYSVNYLYMVHFPHPLAMLVYSSLRYGVDGPTGCVKHGVYPEARVLIGEFADGPSHL